MIDEDIVKSNRLAKSVLDALQHTETMSAGRITMASLYPHVLYAADSLPKKETILRCPRIQRLRQLTSAGSFNHSQL